MEQYPFKQIENREVEPLTTESIIMLVMVFVMVGVLLVCLFSIMCCNCINSKMAQLELGTNIIPAKECGAPISLKENPTSVRMLKTENLRKENVLRMNRKKQGVIWV